MSKPKPKPKGFRDRASRAWNKAFSPSAPSSGSSPPALPAVLLSPAVPDSSAPALHIPLSTSPLPSAAVSAPPPPAPGALPHSQPIPTLSIPSLHVSSTSHGPTPVSNSGTVWPGLSTALRTLHANAVVFPPLQSAIDGLLSGFEMFEESTKNQKEYEFLALELKAMSETLDRHLQGSKTSPMMDFILQTIQSIQEQVNFIAKVQNRDQATRLMEAQRVGEALTACYGYIQALARQIQIEAGLSMRSVNTQLEGLKPAKLATYDSSLSTDVNRRACTEHTRTGVFSDLHTWLEDPNVPNVCWMNGMAGTGKTTIAYTFARELEKKERLAATFFCTRTTAECRDVTRIVPTIAYQLARFSSPFLSSLCRVIDNSPDILSRTISTQFEQLIKKPLAEVEDTLPKQLVIVIDALDECSASNGVRLVLDTLLREAHDLRLKFFVTSRPEPSIRSKIQEQPERSRSIYELHTVKQSDVQADIELYLREELPLVEQAQIRQLAAMSGILFIYAATAVRYIQAGNQKERLKTMLSVESTSTRKHAKIDELYRTILTIAFSNEDLEEEELEQIKLVLWTAVCAREPISVRTLAVLSGIDNEDSTLAALEPLRSVLYVSENHEVVSTLHTSFPDYMFNPTRSSNFFCSSELHDGFLALQCFQVMQGQLRFNICSLKSSYVRDDQVPDLQERVNETITPMLAYACRYWADHLDRSRTSNDLQEKVEKFLLEQLLWWMEVMNLKRWMGLAVQAILTVKLWALNRKLSPKLTRMMEDARTFVDSFAANPVSKSTPHLYMSALAFCHRSNFIHMQHRKYNNGLIEPKGGGIETRREILIASWDVGEAVNEVAYWPDGSQIVIVCNGGQVLIKNAHNRTLGCPHIQGHRRDANSVALSPDGTYIASSSNDTNICIWSAQDGTLVGAPLEGHASYVTSVTFSPDGTRLISGSYDNTVRMWNVRDGTALGHPLTGHTRPVQAVACSPDGTRIASGSWDRTIRMWDAKDGDSIGTPLHGHTDTIRSVVFSRDGSRIISGADDNTIRMWNAQDGTAVGPPLRGHTSYVMSVAFSPDGTRIVSGSLDKTIRMWDAQDGTAFGAPLRVHTNSVKSVMFSPDGTRIVSGSSDGTVCIWSAQDWATVSAPSRSHTGPITSVAFSPDGTRIISGSDDNSVRMWSAQDGTAMGDPLQGHTGPVTSLAFSPDGVHFASGSKDNTIRIWYAQSGSSAYIPLQGHTGPIASVAFSPDGAHMASGSDDYTVRIWNARKGTAVGSPLEGHTESVSSVCYSPDGRFVVSGSSWDGIIRMWNAQDGTPMGSPLEVHNYIISIAFSPIGSCIAFDSSDKSISMWDTRNGAAVGTPLRGHTDIIRSVAFSPDGSRIISGADDKTIRIWNVQDGTAVGPPLRGHTSYVMSVAFSPDGTRIISGSLDKTIRMWDAQNAGGTLVNPPPKAHTSSVYSTAVSTDNIISDFNNHSIGGISTQANTPVAGNWLVTNDGWVTDSSGRLHFWLPSDLALCFPLPHNPWVIGPNGETRVDYARLLPGDEWYKCYSP